MNMKKWKIISEVLMVILCLVAFIFSVNLSYQMYKQSTAGEECYAEVTDILDVSAGGYASSSQYLYNTTKGKTISIWQKDIGDKVYICDRFGNKDEQP